MTRKTYFYELLLLSATVVWGSSFFIIRGLVQTVDPFVLVTYRFGISALIVAGLVLFQKKQLFSNIKKGFLLGLSLWGTIVLQAVGLVYTTAVNSAFITGIFIVFVPILSYMFFKGNLVLSAAVAIVVDVLGLWFLTGGVSEINRGDVLTLVAAVTSGFHVLLVDKYRKDGLDLYVLCFQQFLVVGGLSLLVTVVFGYPLVMKADGAVLKMGILILFPTVICFLIQLVCQKNLSAIKSSLIYTLEPVFAAGFAWTLGGETFVLSRALGGLIIFLGMIIYELPLSLWLRKHKEIK